MSFKVIAIDGPAGSGKSTISRLVANKIGYVYVKTGEMFRSIAYSIIKANIDYTDVVTQLPKKCFTDRLPDGGFYNFRESGDRLWVIADRIKIVRILTEEERINMLKKMNYDEMEAFAPYKKAMDKRMKTA